MLKMKRRGKKGLSPVVATVLLVSMVVVLGLIVFLWLRGLVSEEATKFGKNIKLACGDVEFDANYEQGILTITNGNIPLYDLNIRYGGAGNYDILKLRDASVPLETSGLLPGDVYSEPLGELSGAEEIIIAPILIGSLEQGNKIYECDIDQYGDKITN